MVLKMQPMLLEKISRTVSAADFGSSSFSEQQAYFPRFPSFTISASVGIFMSCEIVDCPTSNAD